MERWESVLEKSMYFYKPEGAVMLVLRLVLSAQECQLALERV